MSATRARRAVTKRVNYAKEQDFSDQDLFEDGEADTPAPAPAQPATVSTPTRGRKKRKPKGDTSDNQSGPLDMILSETTDMSPNVRDYRPIFTEKGYDPSLPPIRERFTFMPEYEEDGTMKIELIVGRRKVDDSAHDNDGEKSDSDMEFSKPAESDKEKEDNEAPSADDSQLSQTDMKDSQDVQESNDSSVVEYEYLVKYKGRSYLHLEWKAGADLESMNKSAKGLYRRYLKKLAQGADDELENPDFDPSFAIPEKVIDEAEQEMTIELTDKELLRWEKQREKELASQSDPNQDGNPGSDVQENSPLFSNESVPVVPTIDNQIRDEKKESEIDEDWTEDEEVDFTNISLERLRAIIAKEGPYYPTVDGSDNPYRDGYITEPPKKPRASYLLFQSAMRSYYQKKNPQAHLQSELMSALGDAWRRMSEIEKAPFMQLALEEFKQYEIQREMLEKAQKPNGVWQPLRRCLMVLERISSDVFAEIFLHPVNTKEFPEYGEIITHPMDLGTVRSRLNSKKYIACEQFARDMRKIFNNCKIFNMHGSMIWYVADYMSKQFERLYQAWVLDFRERYIRWADPRARPWEHSCRIHDGHCHTPDDKMVLCDHCDGMFGLACLNPPLKKVPKQVWHCPECRMRLKSSKGGRMLSAVAENAARKRAELGDLPKKKVNQTMYLVKWAGLGYEFCSWETRKDIGNDKLIAEFHKRNKTNSDEPDLREDTIEKVLRQTSHVNVENAGGSCTIATFRAQLYAQTRALQFMKFGITVPNKVCSEIGPKTHTVCLCSRHSLLKHTIAVDSGTQHSPDVVESLADIVFKVSRSLPQIEKCHSTKLPPPLTGEYDAIIPITSTGLMMNVGEVSGAVAFLGYRQFPGGGKGPAEEMNIIRGHGDKIIAVDGISTIGMSFKDVISLLRESAKNKFAYMRFLENRFFACDQSLASVGSKGRYAFDELQRKFTLDRQRIIVERANETHQDDTNKDTSLDDNIDQESENGSEGSFLPESDDEYLMDEGPSPNGSKEQKLASPQESSSSIDLITENQTHHSQKKIEKTEEVTSTTNDTPYIDGIEKCPQPTEDIVVQRVETTRSLAFRLLDIDVGYSSDEAGDEDCAYFIDGVDTTFSSKYDVEASNTSIKKIPSYIDKNDESEVTLPSKQNEFAVLGDRSKLAAAVALSSNPPDMDDFDCFPHSSVHQSIDDTGNSDDPSNLTKRSTVKVEQLSTTTNEIIHVWANVEAAAATLQLPLNQLKQVLRGEYNEEIGDEVGGFKWGYALAGAKITAGNSTLKGGAGKKAKEAWLQFKDKLYDPNEPHVYKNGNRLRDYQVGGVNWLASTWYKRQGCILSDEMGLGKTVQIVCFIEHLFRVEKIKRPFLVVVPLSTIEHWRREFEGWTDMVCCVYHDRQRIWRDVMREYEWYYEDRPHTAEFLKFDVLVTTYDTLIGDFDVISQIPFRVSVVDEAHRLRNQKGKLLECMREVSARGTMQYGFQSRVLMSGTPLQNDLTELWTLLNFIEPFKFPDLASFQAKFGNMANRTEVEALQKLISPYMLRRVKEDVAKDIPAKEETLIDVELTSIQKQFYRAIFEHNLAFLNMGSTRQTSPKLMNIQMELRKVCNHPYLLEGVEHRESERLYKDFAEKGLFEGKSPEEQQLMLNEHGYVMTSGKMVLLDKLLPKLRQEGHKILIFSQMVKMLDLISEYCDFRGFRHERLDGRVRGTERQKAIDRFEKDKDSFLFLLSTRAGGVGINLTAADVCIIFDSDWNPQNDVQAQARCHRIGQTKDVRIYRLITSRSFEQEMFERASRKLGLEQAILGTFEKEGEDDKPTQQEMEHLLKKGAYALLDDDNDEITREFCADDIESILAKRTRTRVVEGTKTASWLNKNGLVVSKSKFTSESGASLDMDDPMFWQKVMPDFVTPAIMMQKLNDLQEGFEGKVSKGPGRGRGRPKKIVSDDGSTAAPVTVAMGESSEAVDTESAKDENGTNAGDASDDDENGASDKSTKQHSRKNLRAVHTFISELKSMMENILEDAEDEAMKSSDKDVCQKLLLTITVKDKIFNEEQRRLAKLFLKRLEGDRRRRCRTIEQPRFNPVSEMEEPVNRIRDELRIVAKPKKKRKKRLTMDEDEAELLESAARDTLPDNADDNGDNDDQRFSDSEDDWSTILDDSYHAGPKSRNVISRKESLRRRPWGADDDEATVAGRAWPVFPRHVVKPVLKSLIEEVLMYDKSKGGMFSAPVSKDEFPEYYNRIKNPIDYGTMMKKVDNNEYRSAQAMQKDFIVILQNCRQFNDASSHIVKEAREQHLLRPKFLRSAALKHNLFLGEDGTVFEIIDDNKSNITKKVDQGGIKSLESIEINIENGGDSKLSKAISKKKLDSKATRENRDPASEKIPKSTKLAKGKRRHSNEEGENVFQVDDEQISTEKAEQGETNESKRPRIRIKVKSSGNESVIAIDQPGNPTIDGKKPSRPSIKRKRQEEDTEKKASDDETISEDQTKKRRKASEPILTKKSLKKSLTDVTDKDKMSMNDKKKKNGHDKKSNNHMIFSDLSFWKKRRDTLHEGFDNARRNFTEFGPWKLSSYLPESAFTEIAEKTLEKMTKHDKFSVFAEAVTEKQAPGYHQIVKNPMDFGTMKKKVKQGKYGTGSKAATLLYEDFLLVFDNCHLYNLEESEVTDEASRILGLLPEAFASACNSVAKNQSRESSKKTVASNQSSLPG